jgi:hypothetical protein
MFISKPRIKNWVQGKTLCHGDGIAGFRLRNSGSDQHGSGTQATGNDVSFFHF